MKKKVSCCGVIYLIFSVITALCMEPEALTIHTPLPHDIWNKVIACSSNTSKDSLAQTCTALAALSNKTNHLIYIHSPFVLSERQLVFGLYCATHYGNAYAVKNLLVHKAFPNHTTPYLQCLPLAVAEYNNNQEIIRYLKQRNAMSYSPMPPIYAQAVYVGDLPLLNKYLEGKGDSPHYEGAYNNNPILHSAIYNGHTHIIERLLQDPQITPYLNFAGWHGIEPLYFAAQHNRTAITKLLLAACPTMINNVCRNGFSALHVAVDCNNYHVAEALMRHPLIKVNLCNLIRNSPLHTAVKNGNLQIVTLLLSAPNICLNIRNKDNKTPLDLAKKLFTDDIKKLLISKGAQTFFYLRRIAQWNDKKERV